MGPDVFRTVHERWPVVAFFALAVGLSWLVWIPTFALAGDQVVLTLGLIAGSFGPAVAGAALTKLEGRRLRDWLREMAVWRLPVRWYVVALGLPLTWVAATTAVVVAGGGTIDLTTLPRRLLSWAGGMAFVFVAGGGNEEPGWRGYALPRLQREYSALTASVVVGVVWACWHLPMVAFSVLDFGEKPFVLYLPMVVALSVLYTWLYNNTRGSVLLAMLLHASVNTSGALAPVSVETFQRLQGSDLSLSVRLVVGAILAVVLIAAYGADSLSETDRVTGDTRPRQGPNTAGDTGPAGD